MEAIIAIIGGLFGAGGIAAILKTRSDNKKTEAEAELTLGGGWQVLWQTARTESNELRERLAIVEKSDIDCKSRLASLEAQGSIDVEKTVATLIEEAIVKRGGDIIGNSTQRRRRATT